MENRKKQVLNRIIGIVTIPIITLMIMVLLCSTKGIVLFATGENVTSFFRSVSTVMLTTLALSINLNSGRFDFSIGSISLLSSIISSQICIKYGMSTSCMLIISLVSGLLLGIVSGAIYVIVKLPPIIVSLGVALFYEGMAFAITKGYGVTFVTNAELTSFPKTINYVIVILISLLIVYMLFEYTKFGYNYKTLLSGQKVSVNTGIKEIPNAIACYSICGTLMGMVGFLSATNTGNIQLALNFGSIGIMFTAFLPMFIGGFIGRFCNDKVGYLLGAVTTALISLMYTRLKVDSSIQQITTALILVGFLIFLNNEEKIRSIFGKRKETGNEV